MSTLRIALPVFGAIVGALVPPLGAFASSIGMSGAGFGWAAGAMTSGMLAPVDAENHGPQNDDPELLD